MHSSTLQSFLAASKRSVQYEEITNSYDSTLGNGSAAVNAESAGALR